MKGLRATRMVLRLLVRWIGRWPVWVRALAALIGPLLLASLLAYLTFSVHPPTALRLGASAACPSDYPDSYVVTWTERVEGTTDQDDQVVQHFQVGCMNERGQYTHAGFTRPYLLLTRNLFVGLMVLVAVAIGWRALRRRHRPAAHPPVP